MITFLDKPRFFDLRHYENAVDHAVDYLSGINGVKSVYLIGGFSAPGISDIDMVVVFKDGFTFQYDPRANFSDDEKYLFIHKLYGVPEKYFVIPEARIFFHNYKLLNGFSYNLTDSSGEYFVNNRFQVAMEFMLKMLVVLGEQQSLKTVKVRSFLLEGHGLQYDMDLIGAFTSELKILLDEIEIIRATIFEGYELQNLVDLQKRFYQSLKICIENLLSENNFFIDTDKNDFIYAGHRFRKDERLSIESSGLALPFLVKWKAKKGYNIARRFSNLNIKLPYNRTVVPADIDKRFTLCSELNEYNKKHLPAFLPLTSNFSAGIR